MMWARLRDSVSVLALVSALQSCDASEHPPTVYASVDRLLAEPVLGDRSNVVFDTEANKTVGLVSRLRAERGAPRADIFWNGEIARTIELCREGTLLKGALQNLVGNYSIVDPAGCWIGVAARARIAVVSDHVANELKPRSILDLVNVQWRGRAAIGDPRFGTTATHFAALYVMWGETRFRTFVQEMRANAVTILPGNAQVKDAVAQGRFAWGLTDTDDGHGAMLEGAAISVVFPDQHNELGLLLIPNTVALVTGGPHPDEGRRFAEYLVSTAAEAKLASGRGAHIPIRHDVPGPKAWPDAAKLRRMDVSYEEIANALPAMLRAFDEEWPQ